MRRHIVLPVFTLTFFLVVLTVAAQSPEPLLGTWKVNIEKSTYSPGPPPKGATRVVEDLGGGLLLSTQRGIDAQGSPTWAHYAFRFDSKDYPYAASTTPGTSPVFTTIAFKRVDANTFENATKQDGKVSATNIYTISKDGKTLTQRQKSTNAQGQPTDNVIVFEKQ